MAVLVSYHKRFFCGMDCRMADYSCLVEQLVFAICQYFHDSVNIRSDKTSTAIFIFMQICLACIDNFSFIHIQPLQNYLIICIACNNINIYIFFIYWKQLRIMYAMMTANFRWVCRERSISAPRAAAVRRLRSETRLRAQSRAHSSPARGMQHPQRGRAAGGYPTFPSQRIYYFIDSI